VSKIYEALKKAEHERERVRQETGHPVPRTVDTAPLDIAEEEYQKLRASLTSIAVPSGLHTILVTAPRHGEGATTVAVGLASALAKEREARVLVLEGNLRTPCLQGLLPVNTERGVAEYADGRADAESLPVRVDTLNLSVITAGTVPSRPLDLEFLDALLTRLRAQFDFVVIDGPPVNRYADASVIATKVDGVILVVEADNTPVVEAEAAKRQLDKVGARILGVVLNRRRSYIPALLENLL
jgi:capsular exopolysaccharide synthesis family protein